MATRKPLVIIGGTIQTLPPADSINTGSTTDVGIVYDFVGITRTVPVAYQYLISGALILDLSSAIIAQGQVVVI